MPALRQISSELNIPEPAKSRILLEMAADLEALYEHYRGRGLAEDEAARQAEDTVLASPEVLQHLIAMHTTGLERWLNRAAVRVRWGFDALLFGLGVVPVLALSTLVVAARIREVQSAPLWWPLLVVAMLIVAVALAKVRQLFLQRHPSASGLRHGLSSLAFLGVLGPVLGGIGFLVGLYNLAILLMSRMPETAVQLSAAEQIARDGTLLGFGLLLGIGAGLIWFVLVSRIATIEQAESAALVAAE